MTKKNFGDVSVTGDDGIVHTCVSNDSTCRKYRHFRTENKL